ncbi:hypothetical protein [Romboutsia sp.]|uniref:hypothetical protein n=1 Tax=Romboutsia sp. TaxID=1965302 RepID=UPI003F3B55F7
MSKIVKYALEIDEEGGPISNPIPMKENEVIDIQNRRNMRTPKQLRMAKNKSDMQLFNEDNGGFVAMYYVKNELLFNELEIDLASVGRVIYLATYLDYDKNVLVMNGGINSGKAKTPMIRKDMQYILGLGDTAFKKFLKDVKDNGLLMEENGLYKVNTEYFNKGKVDKKKSYTRIYIDTVRELYKGCKSTQHKTLAYVFRLIPKIHYDTNTICHNPSEEIPIHLNLTEISEFLGVRQDNSSKLMKELTKFYIFKNDIKYNLLAYITVTKDGATKGYFAVNPYILYGGSNYEQVKDLIGKLFF